ncbi:hypothetical protein Plhal304r1_c046g0126741 [Plasmopara halstedii]
MMAKALLCRPSYFLWCCHRLMRQYVQLKGMSQNVVCCSEFAILVSLYRTKGSLICTAMPYPLTCFVAAPTDSKFNASRYLMRAFITKY